jgi:hypothetical protein
MVSHILLVLKFLLGVQVQLFQQTLRGLDVTESLNVESI